MIKKLFGFTLVYDIKEMCSKYKVKQLVNSTNAMDYVRLYKRIDTGGGNL